MSIMMVLSQWNPKRNIPLFTMPSHVPFTQSSPLVPLANSQFSPASDSEPSPPSSHASSNPADEPFSPAVSPKIPVLVEAPYPRTRSKLKRPQLQTKYPPASHSQKSPLSPGKVGQKAGMPGSRTRKYGELSQLRPHSTVPECFSHVFCLWLFLICQCLRKSLNKLNPNKKYAQILVRWYLAKKPW